MNLLPERALLAVAAVVDVALNGRAAPVPARALAERLGLAPRHLEPLLQALVRAGILKGTRGPRGGYAVARERRRITAADILRVAVGEDDADVGLARPALFAAVVEPALRDASHAFLAELDRVTLGDLCARAESTGTAPVAGLDFAI